MYGQRNPHHPNLRQRPGEFLIRCACGEFSVTDKELKEAVTAWDEHVETKRQDE